MGFRKVNRFVALALVVSFKIFGQAEIPPPNGCNDFSAVESDGDGIAAFNLDVCRQIILNNVMNNLGYDFSGYHIEIYPSIEDYNAQTNAYGPIFYNTQQYQYTYATFTYVGPGPQYSFDILVANDCNVLLVYEEGGDIDHDGVLNGDEDVNGNGLLEDDDTDGDHISNVWDTDDDNDGIPTLNEDYNGDGNPANDDTNQDGIPDYLESSVALSAAENRQLEFSVYPNPAHDAITVTISGEPAGNVKGSLYDVNGKLIRSFQDLSKPASLHGVSSGTYVLHIESGNREAVKKIVVE